MKKASKRRSSQSKASRELKVVQLWLNVDPLADYNPFMNEEHYIDGQHNGGVYNFGNLNPYIYTYQNPIRYIDPNGKQVDVVDFIPFVGSGRDIYRGIRDGDMVTLGIGVAGMALDIGTAGAGGSLIKGGLKAGLKIAAKDIAKAESKNIAKTLTKAELIVVNKAAGKALEKTVTKELAEQFGEGAVKSQITARFADGSAVVFDDVIVKGGKITAINETKSGAAKLTKQQARFFEKGEAVKFVGDKAAKAGIKGESITNKTVKVLRNGN